MNVSRQYLVRLLDEGRIPFRKTGKHRRLRIEDVLSFKDSSLPGITKLSNDHAFSGGAQAPPATPG